MRFKEHDCVVLTRDLPEDDLRVGDVGAVIHVHKRGIAYEVEFLTFTGATIAVATVTASCLRAVDNRDITHVRQLESAGR